MCFNSDFIKLVIDTAEYCLKEKKVAPIVKFNSLRVKEIYFLLT